MKRIITFTLLLCILSSALFGCSTDEATNKATTTTTSSDDAEIISPDTVLHSSLYEIDLSKYVTVPVKYEDLMLSQKFIDQAVQEDAQLFIETYGTVVEYEDPETVTKKGDILEIYYTGSAVDPSVELSENTLKGMTNASDEQGMTITIGSGRLIGAYENEEKPELTNPGFEDQLIGHKKGDKYVLTVTCPDAYSNEELRGLEVNFEVEIVSVSYIKETELTDELVKNNTNYESAEAFLKDSEDYFKKYHAYQGLIDIIKVTEHEDKKITTANMITEYLFKDLGLVITQGDYEKMLKEHYDLNAYYYYYYYGIASETALETAMGKDSLILYFEEEMIKDKLVEYITMTD